MHNLIVAGKLNNKPKLSTHAQNKTHRTCAGPCGGSTIGDCSGGCPGPYAYPREPFGFGFECAYGLFADAEARL